MDFAFFATAFNIKKTIATMKSEANRLFSGILKRILINSDFYRTAIIKNLKKGI